MNSPLDAQTVEQIRQLGGDRLLSDLVEIYTDQAPKRLAEIRLGIDNDDLERAAKGAHSFRSSSISLGARDLAEQAAQLERWADNGEAERVREGLEGFEISLQKMLAFLDSEFGGGR